MALHLLLDDTQAAYDEAGQLVALLLLDVMRVLCQTKLGYEGLQHFPADASCNVKQIEDIADPLGTSNQLGHQGFMERKVIPGWNFTDEVHTLQLWSKYLTSDWTSPAER